MDISNLSIDEKLKLKEKLKQSDSSRTYQITKKVRELQRHKLSAAETLATANGTTLDYSRGYYNGIEMALVVLTDREPDFK